MALPTLPSWQAAHQVFESTTGLWARTDLTAVITAGSGSHDEVSRLRMQAPPGGVIVTVATTVALETAIARAEVDPTRGVSKEQSFLERVYQQWPIELERIAPDVLIRMDHCTVEEAVARVKAAIRTARRKPA